MQDADGPDSPGRSCFAALRVLGREALQLGLAVGRMPRQSRWASSRRGDTKQAERCEHRDHDDDDLRRGGGVGQQHSP